MAWRCVAYQFAGLVPRKRRRYIIATATLQHLRPSVLSGVVPRIFLFSTHITQPNARGSLCLPALY